MSMTHPFDTDALYELMDDGNVKVSKDGKFGIKRMGHAHIYSPTHSVSFWCNQRTLDS